MRCPFCADQDTRVIDSRLSNEGDQVRRRRECNACKERFTTYEVVEITLPRVIKRSGEREAFNEAKLRAGMQRALERRPVGSDALESALTQIKRQLTAKGEREVSSSYVGELVMQALSVLDNVAYVRFASVYRRFQDVSEFTAMINNLPKA